MYIIALFLYCSYTSSCRFSSEPFTRPFDAAYSIVYLQQYFSFRPSRIFNQVPCSLQPGAFPFFNLLIISRNSSNFFLPQKFSSVTSYRFLLFSFISRSPSNSCNCSLHLLIISLPSLISSPPLLLIVLVSGDFSFPSDFDIL